MKKFLVILMLCTSVLFGNIPHWFQNTPETPPGVYVSVGYTDNFFNRDAARKIAINRAVKNMAKSYQLELIFELSRQSDGRFSIGRPEFEEIYEMTVFNEIMTNHKIIDSLFTDRHCFFLIQYPAESPTIKVNADVSSWGEKPSWVVTLPENDDYYYGVGVAANYFRFSRAWKDTDAFARFDVGKNIFLRVDYWLQDCLSEKSDRTNSFSSQYYDIFMYGCEIVRRWYDREHDIYYSLARLAKDSYKVQQ